LTTATREVPCLTKHVKLWAEGVAVRVDRVLAKLREWRYPISLDKFTRSVGTLLWARRLPQGWRELPPADVLARMNNVKTYSMVFPPNAKLAVVQSLRNNSNSVIIGTQPMSSEFAALSADAIKNRLDKILPFARGMFEPQGFKVGIVSKAAKLSGDGLVGARMVSEKSKDDKKLIDVWVVCRNPSDPSTILYLYGEADEKDRDELERVMEQLLGKQ
jgi:hypothetical protein